MSHASNLAIHERGLSPTRTSRKSRPATRNRRVRLGAGDAVLDHYLKRVDPEVAASFTDEQRAAIKTMLGARGIAKHWVEVRRSLPLGRRRFYLVFLLGAERRSLSRLHLEGQVSRPLALLVYVGLAVLALAPVIGVLAANRF